MDLIYTDSSREDLGVLQGYKLDEAFGKDENDFEITTDLLNTRLQEDYFIYIEGTEYGGIIDSVAPDTSKNTIVYSGRTWHGILNSKVIETLTLYGDIHDSLRAIISQIGLTSLFEVKEGLSGIESYDFQFTGENSYVRAYDGILKLCDWCKAKLKMKWKDKKILIWCELVKNYSIDEEFDTSKLELKLKKKYNVCNHLILVSKNEDKLEYIIHLFTDYAGNVQPYKLVEKPSQDSEYITTKENQFVTGEDEITKILECSVSVDTNYLILTDKPDDWELNYSNYYTLKVEVDEETEEVKISFEQVERNLKAIYELLFHKPIDWETNYKDYYYRKTDDKGNYVIDENGDYEYENATNDGRMEYTLLSTKPAGWDKDWMDYYYLSNVENGKQTWSNIPDVTKDIYTKLTSKPSKWEEDDAYENYYYRWSDGLTREWRRAEGITKTRMKRMTIKPSDWSTNWKNYYCIYMTGDFTKLGNVALYNKRKKAPKWKTNSKGKSIERRFYTQEYYTVAPKFGSRTYYAKSTKPDIPAFDGSNWKDEYDKYKKIASGKKISYPEWKNDYYYRKSAGHLDVGIVFQPNVYYNKVENHYKSMIEQGIEEFRKIYNSDEISLDLNQYDNNYDIGDIIGAQEPITGIFVAQPISKKIITIEKDNIKIEYEVNKSNGS